MGGEKHYFLYENYSPVDGAIPKKKSARPLNYTNRKETWIPYFHKYSNNSQIDEKVFELFESEPRFKNSRPYYIDAHFLKAKNVSLDIIDGVSLQFNVKCGEVIFLFLFLFLFLFSFSFSLFLSFSFVSFFPSFSFSFSRPRSNLHSNHQRTPNSRLPIECHLLAQSLS